MNEIDFVVPWVDSEDSNWQSEFEKYKDDGSLSSDVTKKRYRDWGLFKYWFRGVEKYAPWVNKIHLITCGHYPEWLNLEHPKLNLVKHEDYIPKRYLPVFSSHPIELNMHRIEGLSEEFVYFNDDFFIVNECVPEHFFKNKKPNDAAILNAYDGTGFTKIQINNVSLINKNFYKNKVVRNSVLNWINLKYGTLIIRTLLLMPWKNFTGFYDHHLPNSFLRSTLEEVWEKEFEVLDNTSSNRFRDLNEDVSQYLFRFWQLASNNFNPSPKHKLGDFCPVGISDFQKIIKVLKSTKKPIIVLNDHDPDDLDMVISELTKVFEEKFPEKSSFEL